LATEGSRNTSGEDKRRDWLVSGQYGLGDEREISAVCSGRDHRAVWCFSEGLALGPIGPDPCYNHESYFVETRSSLKPLKDTTTPDTGKPNIIIARYSTVRMVIPNTFPLVMEGEKNSD